MSRKKVFKTAEEAVEYLFSEELESEMIVLPPEVDEFTDEEDFDDSETLDPSVRDVICPIICRGYKSGFNGSVWHLHGCLSTSETLSLNDIIKCMLA
ncbi:hypothetical protein NPIL_23571 [Nephila pilipes]|uniref:Uncharacterized protein n=1 Tax=Nephila pilipes TaxID=299642 RepID=A0A8X6PHF0_NEPPI|nr:hypothetical protein NPIL_23571 [Nephila pilipes]